MSIITISAVGIAYLAGRISLSSTISVSNNFIIGDHRMIPRNQVLFYISSSRYCYNQIATSGMLVVHAACWHAGCWLCDSSCYSSDTFLL